MLRRRDTGYAVIDPFSLQKDSSMVSHRRQKNTDAGPKRPDAGDSRLISRSEPELQ